MTTARAGVFPWRSLSLLGMGLATGAVGVLVRSARVPALVLILLGGALVLAGAIGLWRGPRWGAATVVALLATLLALSVGAEVLVVRAAMQRGDALLGAVLGGGLVVLVLTGALAISTWAYRGRAPRG